MDHKGEMKTRNVCSLDSVDLMNDFKGDKFRERTS